MNRNALCLLCLLLMLGGPVILPGQPKLAIDTMWSLPLDTVVFNNNNPMVTYTMVVKNTGNAKLDGPVTIKTKYNTWTQVYDKYSWVVADFEVDETDTVTFTDTIANLSSFRYKGGDNILVIWPHADNPTAQVPDTTNYGIYVDDLTGIAELHFLGSQVEVYPNPLTGQLNIQYLKDKHKVESVRICNMQGQVLFDRAAAVEQIDTDALSSGVYLLEIRYKDGRIGVARLTKSPK
jgi:hypothetical protein